jgi:hypothetical protein
MTNIIQFPTKEVPDVEYLAYGDGVVSGLTITGESIELNTEGGEISIVSVDNSENFNSRESAAKFFWACAYYLDSEQRYAEDTYVGLNYDTEENDK